MSIFSEIRDEYVTLSTSRALFNYKSSLGFFYSLMGATIHKRGITVRQADDNDLRIHFILFQPSRTGKQVALNMMDKLAKILGVFTTQELLFSDAGLVGQIDSEAHKSNKSKGAHTPEDPKYREALILGELGLYDICSFPEAKTMFKTDQFTKDLREILQMATDKDANMKKRLAADLPIEYKTRTTIIGTTYFLEEVEEIITKQGLFQRFLMVHDPFPQWKRKIVLKALDYLGVKNRDGTIRKELPEEILEKVDSDIVPYDEVDPRLEALGARILEAVNSYPENFVMYKSLEAAEKFSQYNDTRFKMVDAYFVGRDVEVVGSFLTSLDVLHHKLATVAAILNGHDLIEREDVVETHEAIRLCYDAIANDILARILGANPEAIKKSIIGKLKKAGPKGLNMKELINNLALEYSFEDKKIRSVIKSMIDGNMLIQNEKIIKLRALSR